MTTLSERDYNYLINVRRMKIGDRFSAVTREGTLYQAEIVRIERGTCTLALEEEAGRGEPDGLEITLIQALPKGRKMDTIIRQAAECGVSAIQPVVTERTVVALCEADIQKKQQRWEKIVREAVQQSGSRRYSEIFPLIRLREIPFIDKNRHLGLFFHQTPLENHSLHGYLSSNIDKVDICIGPEGGFSDIEIKDMIEKNYRPAYLGEQVLRTETAAVYTLGAIQCILRERRLWIPAGRDLQSE